MHFTFPLLCLLSTSASALPSFIDTKRQQSFSYNGPLGSAEKCPNAVTAGAPVNYPNYACLVWSSSTNWVGINLYESNSTALMAFSDTNCEDRISFIETPESLENTDGQFCAKQSKNGGAGSWNSVMYRIP